MAENDGPKKKGWRKVVRQYQARSTARRGSPAFTVTQHGHVSANVGGTMLVDKTAIARGIDPTKEYMIESLVDEERELVAIYAVEKGSPGASTITRYQSGASSRISFHIGGAFLEAPSLRPEVRKATCLVAEELDENGLPVITIPTKAGKAKITQSRGQTPGSQAAAGETPE